MAEPITVVAILHAKEGSEDAAREALNGLLEPTHAEEGCVKYTLNRDMADPARLVFVEEWASEEALGAHGASAHMAELGNHLELFAAAPIIYMLENVGTGDSPKGSLS